ncbi:MAG: flagellar biosynthesis anti-sigma factor FlgM [Paraglaciecola sp.]|uniref:flagellar biosynthesis anti-sigma factor FlgM n=1 Tax=Pseudomonadati TaxID=3379134 RepID=UPI00273E75B2|nr:flagellar biosynthesis anti-sigma factor FlgM [Paraglaciecola sp.]MDP5032934.1 flagellar biosynthesis anti-sigma factor FlgM [Paraglaciecola sp.]MDP5134237.1 flagellar biosynthesis anti-sigma factor FlgM [Paraglaciecola sp.]
MAINNVNNGGVKSPIDNQKLSQQQTLNNTTNQAESQKAASATNRQDSVSLTQSAQQLVQVQRKGTEAPINQEKVDRIKKAIQSGQYSVNPEALAKKIANMESELFGTKA